jgi:hypothetical protein
LDPTARDDGKNITAVIKPWITNPSRVEVNNSADDKQFLLNSLAHGIQHMMEA